MINFKNLRHMKLRDIQPKRFLRFQFLKLLRSPYGAKQVSAGFAIGFGMEMITPYTLYIAYMLLLPFAVIKSARPALPAAIIGNLVCKVTFLPMLLIPVAWNLERTMFPPPHHHASHLRDWLAHYQRIFLILSVFGAVLGILSYFIVYFMLVIYQRRRLARRKLKRQATNASV